MSSTSVDVAEMVRLYVDEGLTTYVIGAHFRLSSAGVWARLKDAGVELRQRGNPPKLGEDELRQWYVVEQLSTVQIAARTGMSTSGVTSALERAGIDRRQRVPAVLAIDDATLADLYVRNRLSEQEIAHRFRVTPWTVRQRLRNAGIKRPNGALPGGDVPAPSASELSALYSGSNWSLADLGARYGVPDPTIRRWLELADIPLRQQPVTAGVRPDESVDLSRPLLWEQYVHQGRTTAEIAAELGVTKNIVLMAMHSQRIPVRPSGPRGRPAVVLLDALYADSEVTSVLKRHRIPRRPTEGTLRERWPEPVELTAKALGDLYERVGLSVAHISLLTGIQIAGVRHRLQRAGLTARGGGRSPWKAQAGSSA